MKQYLLSIYQPGDGTPPAKEVLEPIMRNIAALNEDMRRAGAFLFTGGLHAPSTATVAAVLLDIPDESDESEEEHVIRDDQLRLMFTCCHPALAVSAQVALTLRGKGFSKTQTRGTQLTLNRPARHLVTSDRTAVMSTSGHTDLYLMSAWLPKP